MNTSIVGLLPRISYKFVRLADALLIIFVTNLIAMITGNTKFPTPTPTLVVLQAALDDFIQRVQEAFNGGKIATAARRATRRTLLALVGQLAAYVAFTAGSDIAALLSSGFDAVKASSSTVPVNPPSSIQLLQGAEPGTLVARLLKKGSNGVSFKASPLSGDISLKNCCSTAIPPADAPSPTTAAGSLGSRSFAAPSRVFSPVISVAAGSIVSAGVSFISRRAPDYTLEASLP